MSWRYFHLSAASFKSICIPMGHLVVIVAVNAFSLACDCLPLDSNRKDLKLRSISATSNKGNNSTCPGGLKGLVRILNC